MSDDAKRKRETELKWAEAVLAHAISVGNMSVRYVASVSGRTIEDVIEMCRRHGVEVDL